MQKPSLPAGNAHFKRLLFLNPHFLRHCGLSAAVGLLALPLAAVEKSSRNDNKPKPSIAADKPTGWPVLTMFTPVKTHALPRASLVEAMRVLGDTMPAAPELTAPVLPMWVPASTPFASDTVIAIAVVRGEEKRIAPYSGGNVRLIDRVVALAKDGRFWFSQRLSGTSDHAFGARCIAPMQVRFTVPEGQGKVGVDGVFTAAVVDPLAILTSGYQVEIDLPPSTAKTAVVVAPDYAIEYQPLLIGGAAGAGGAPPG